MERRNTFQKELVLGAVTQMRRHVTADEIYTFIRNGHPRIGKGTVYRNLGILAGEKKIRKIAIPDGPDCFDFTLRRHYHVRCIKCGQVFDVVMDEIKEIESLIKDKQGMIFLDYDILFQGICQQCQSKQEGGC